VFSRFFPRRIDIGLGPEPLINNVYHKRALEKYGYTAQTFVTSVYFITQDFDKKYIYKNNVVSILAQLFFIDFVHVLFSYKCLYIYFNGGPLHPTRMLWHFEPFLLDIARIRTVIMPYGGDIQIFNRTPNLYLRHCSAMDYPLHKLRYSLMNKRLELWTNKASHVISGCDWVDYMYHWDTLMVAHFSIDMNIFKTIQNPEMSNRKTFKVLHAPNHRNLKGTRFVVSAVRELKEEGFDVELVLVERKPNAEILALIQQVDLVVDQLVVGWYAMFAIEAMAARKPVVCYLRDDLLNLYRCAGLIGGNDPPLINSSPLTFKHDLKKILQDPSWLADFACRGYDYVNRVHSIDSVGHVFDRINRSLDVLPSVAIPHQSQIRCDRHD
jgi:hypothetical protein